MRITFPMVYAAGLFASAIVGFSYNLDSETRAPDLFSPKFVVHGVACLAWLSLLFVQASLVGSRNTKLHRRLGRSAPIVAGLVVVSSVYVGVTSLIATGWGRLLTYGNVAAVVVFGLFIAAGYRARDDREAHRRLMLVGTLFMMGPVFTRLGGAIHPVAFLLANVTAWVAVVGYDRARNGRIHKSTWLAVAVLFIYLAYTAVTYDVRLGG